MRETEILKNKNLKIASPSDGQLNFASNEIAAKNIMYLCILSFLVFSNSKSVLGHWEIPGMIFFYNDTDPHRPEF